MSVAEELCAEAEALERSGDQSRAHEKWLAAASEDGRSTRILNGLGRSHMLLGHLAEAEAILRQASLLDVEDGESLWLLGFVLHSQGRWDDARTALEQGLARREWSTARIMLGEVCWRLGDSNSALRHYEQAVVDDPNDPNGWYGMGMVLEEVSGERAAELFRKAIAVNQQYWLAHRELGWILSQFKRYDEAEGCLREAVRLAPEDAMAHAYLGSVLAFVERWVEAEQESRIAVRMEPRNALYRCNWADALTALGRIQEAEAEYRSALATDVNYYLANLRYGQFLERQGRLSKARMYLERTLAFDPDNARAKGALERIARAAARDNRNDSRS
jgi:tetratricopeptide (TPR) repeat protein